MVLKTAQQLFFSLLLLLIVGFAIPAQAETFDDFTPGDLNGQNDWHTSQADTAQWQVSDNLVTSGYSLMIDDNNCSGNVCEATTTMPGVGDSYYVSASFYQDDLRDGDLVIYIRDVSYNYICGFGFQEEPNGNVQVTLQADNDKFLGQPATSTWTPMAIKIDTIASDCTLFYGDISTTSSITFNNTPQELFIWASDALTFGDPVMGLDNITVSSISSYTGECLTCTRITATDPYNDQLIATSSSYFSTIDYYVAPSDYSEGNTYISMELHPLINDYVETQDNDNQANLITSSGDSQTNFALSLTNAGTYKVFLNIYTLTTSTPWYLPWRNDYTSTNLMQQYEFIFHAGSITTQADIDLAKAQAEARREQNPEGLSGKFKANLDEALNTFLYMPPIGYGTIIYNAFATTTATTSISMTYTIAEGFPGEGLTLTLNASDAIANAISQIDSEVVATIDGSPFDEFMYYWQLLWYGALVIWIFKQVFGMFQIDITNETVQERPTNYQKRGTVKGQSPVERGRGGIYLDRKRYKSYDR